MPNPIKLVRVPGGEAPPDPLVSALPRGQAFVHAGEVYVRMHDWCGFIKPGLAQHSPALSVSDGLLHAFRPDLRGRPVDAELRVQVEP